MTVGRPTKYRVEYCEQLFQHMSEGLSYKTFAATVGVCREVLYDWERAHPPFLHSKKRGLEAQELFYEKFGRSAMAGKIKGFNATAFVWMTKNMLGWRDRQEVEMTVNQSKDVETIEQLKQDYLRLQNTLKDLPERTET